MGKFVVYCHTTPSGRRYVGITSTDPEKRFRDGRGYEKSLYFYRAIKKYGWDNIDHQILYTGLDEAEAKEIEARLVRDWNLTDRRFGYNIRSGGDGPLANETKEKMSRARKGNKYCLGRIMSDDAKAKVSESLKRYYSDRPGPFSGRHHSEETKSRLSSRIVSDETKSKMRKNHADVSGSNNPSSRKVIMCDMEWQEIKTFQYAKLAAIETGADLSGIIKCCRGKKKSCGGYKWKYADD